MGRPPVFPEFDRRMNGHGLTALARWRGQGLSIDSIARKIEEDLGLVVSRELVRRWLKGVSVDNFVASPRPAENAEARDLFFWPDNLLRRLRSTPSGCVEYVGADTGNGYKRVLAPTGYMLAHRASYEFFLGPIPEDHVLHHTCHNTACVKPGHLEPMTRSDHSKGHALERKAAA